MPRAVGRAAAAAATSSAAGLFLLGGGGARRAAAQSWQQLGADLDVEARGGEVGSSVVVSGEGYIVAVGTGVGMGVGAHVTCVYALGSGGVWAQMGDDITASSSSDTAVALSSAGTILALGMPGDAPLEQSMSGSVAAFKYDSTDDEWDDLSQRLIGNGQAYDNFGYRVSLSDDGKTIGAGGPIGSAGCPARIYTPSDVEGLAAGT